MISPAQAKVIVDALVDLDIRVSSMESEIYRYPSDDAPCWRVLRELKEFLDTVEAEQPPPGKVAGSFTRDPWGKLG